MMRGNFINHYRIPIAYFEDLNECAICFSHSKDNDGYPLITRVGKQWRMNRFIYHFLKEPIPEGLVVRHTCDNKGCINPEHLILGTAKDNAQDREERGGSSKGEGNGRATLTNKQVIEIYKDRKTPRSVLAKKYNTGLGGVYNIHKKTQWKSVLNKIEDIEYSVYKTRINGI